jgi:hypothetical protein
LKKKDLLPISEANSSRCQIDNDDPNFDRKLDLVTTGAKPHIREHLLTKISKENCKIIVDYVIAFLTEVSPAESYRIDTIGKLKQLASTGTISGVKTIISRRL